MTIYIEKAKATRKATKEDGRKWQKVKTPKTLTDVKSSKSTPTSKASTMKARRKQKKPHVSRPKDTDTAKAPKKQSSPTGSQEMVKAAETGGKALPSPKRRTALPEDPEQRVLDVDWKKRRLEAEL